MAYLNTTSATTSSLNTRIGSAFDALVARYKQHRLYRETFDGLSALSNRELADLGLTRCEIKRVAKKAAQH